MGKDLKQIEQLLSLFDHRDKQIDLVNKSIAESLNDTLLVALKDLFGVADGCLVWEDMQVEGTILVLRVGVEYNPQEPMTPFLATISSGLNTSDPIKVNRSVYLGIPFSVIFQPKQQVIEWFTLRANQIFNDEQPSTKPSLTKPALPEVQQEFDPESLTRDQISQLLYFQQTTNTMKQ